MLQKIGLSIVLTASVIGAADAQTKLVEKVTKKGDELVIPYEKYKLSNGLTLIVHEDHSDPVVHVDVTYHVGSAREEVGKSGFAHFFEHMMFQGSDNVADEEHFKIVSDAGGTLNGTTNRDRTNYFETVPSNQLETALWLEADRMGFLLDAVTQKKFEVQRETVKNERGQNYDNRPYGLVYELTSKNLYDYGHPYSWTTIGYLEDLNRVNVNDLKNFFLRWYGPNNATITVGGDVKPADVVKLVEKYFGSIPAGPAVEDMKPMVAKLEKDRYISYEDNVRFPMLRMTFPTPESGHKDEAALDVLAEIIGQGKNSIFYKNMVKEQKALQASASNSTSELAGEFGITVMAFPNNNLAASEALVRKSIGEFETRGVTEDDLQRYKASAESNLINRLASVSGKVSQLASFETFENNPNYIQEALRRIQAVTKEDVNRVYNQYIKGKPAVILSVVPKGKSDLIAKADNYTVDTKKSVAMAQEYGNLKYTKAVDSFDRSKRPTAGQATAVTVPNYYTTKFKNGLEIIGTKSDEIPTVTLQLTIQGGHRLSAANPGKAGIASLTASMLNEDTENYTSEEFSSGLDKLGSSIRIGSGSEDTYVIVQSLKKNLDKTLALLEERMFRPKFAQDDFDRLKKQQLEGIANQSTQPTAIANNVYYKLLYGEGHIEAISTSGTAETVNSITLDDVKQFYKASFSPSVSNLVVVGDISEKDILGKLDFLKKWEKKKVTMPADVKAPAIAKTRLYFVDKPGAAQSEIRIGYVAMPYDATGEYYKTNLMNFALGGAFNSRINLNLREDKGYTYGARSNYAGTKYAGPFTAMAGVRADATAASVVEFMKEINDFRTKGITEAELQFMKNSIGQSDARKYETPGQKAGFLGRIIEYDLKKDYVNKQTSILNNITKKEIDALASKHLPADNMHIVVVGDKKTVMAELQKLNYEIVELDANGNPVGTSSVK
ncbi:insulinase family protein [Pontibacter sp. BT310]|uniref:Insulinase family protein n=1 Tax=Pontibacter populi TaxID=890055 RepID=A0ABS6XA86_9BACT|nr:MULTISPECIES: pitrilysin family protein [Pontibacter]MBJ6117964.1 insulinase family protein [Pontibacter sp. BT310]MBR0570391.1 insulinase family protein [Microvirga sp. STS03]MBW3364817.1 insulinase family protein [Pontibacter populi]